ncbi:hypothetical protein Sango_2919600 [Sesamum angolense]|uniref:DUF659 domain-containing protein n=1 Tax=Sesamum angolense TaxID=2727404 RepID=A0AAE1W030_9LAMI|nr:hypothetical protein Sango_2919600 [Sesamum angolense]
MKQHLVGEKENVASCKKVPPEIRFMIQGSLKDNVERAKEKRGSSAIDEYAFGASAPELSYDYYTAHAQKESHKQQPESSKKKAKTGLESFFKISTRDPTQPTIKASLQSKEKWYDIDMAIALWFYDSCISLNACNSSFFQIAISKVACMGHGYAGPSYHALRVSLSKDAKKQVALIVDSFRSKWIEIGCTIMGDGWKNSRQRPLVNYFVYCPFGISFIKYVDVSAIESTAENLCNLFAEIVEMVGVKNVVHSVTDNSTNYKAAGWLLSEKYPTICWSPAYCVNLILEDIAFQYDKEFFCEKTEVLSGLLDYIDTVDNKAYNEISLYRDGQKSFARPTAMTIARSTRLNRVKYSKRPYDPFDYECIDKSEFWIVEETPECELDYDEMEELLEEEMPRYDEESSFDPLTETNNVEPIAEADLEQFGCQSRSTYYSDNEDEDDWD